LPRVVLKLNWAKPKFKVIQSLIYGGHQMKQTITAVIITILSFLWINSVSAFDCSGLQNWHPPGKYQAGDQVQYEGNAYLAIATTTKNDLPGNGDPWELSGVCDPGGGDDGGGGDGGGGVEPQQLLIYGVWHCGNHYCDWSDPDYTPSSVEFNEANQWIIEGNDGNPSVNLVVLSFLEPLELLYQTTNDAFQNGIPIGMTSAVVNYFKSHGIRVMLSMGGITYTESWNIALTTDAAELARLASQAVKALGADGLEIDWENGTPNDEELVGIEEFIETYNNIRRNPDSPLANTLLTLDLAVGDRYLQELSRRAAADWLLPDPDDLEQKSKIDYINAMVPRGEPSTDQWQEHVDGKLNYNPPILPKAPAKIVVSLWLTNGNRPNDNCVDFASSTQLEKADYVQTVLPNGAGTTAGFLGYMFWAAGCPSTRNVCTTPPNTCENGMGTGASYFNISTPIGTLRAD